MKDSGTKGRTTKKRSRHPVSTKERFIQLRAEGVSLVKASKALKVSKSTLVEWNGKLREEIAARRAVELDALQEQYFISKEEKIRLFGKKIKLILSEIDKRDLSDIPTGKLFDLLLQYHAALEAEAVNPVFRTVEEIASDKKMAETFKVLNELATFRP